MTSGQNKLYILLISVHGLLRGQNLELGRDADTGGQIKYVVELANALARHPDVAQVDLLTRRVVDSEVSGDYAQHIEILGNNARIVRIDAGPDAYIPKELLWDHLDAFADNTMDFLRENARTPDIIHSHYADAGYVGMRLASLLGVPLVHTGHSLGRVKRRRLLASGVKPGEIESRYNMARRIEAEEDTLSTANLVIASTHNEINDQYARYDQYNPESMTVIPPGTDLHKFLPPDQAGDESESSIAKALNRFLENPDKPIVLALSRPDERKNIASLIKAYGESVSLRDTANLVIVAGNRDDIHDMENGPASVLTEILVLIDQYDLYGKAAYPKHHFANDVPILYRLAAASGGVFVNPALTEPFGLTLIEAAASGLPIVATEDGGPQDIIGNCHNGILIDPLDTAEMAKALLKLLSDKRYWSDCVASGLKGVKRYYSWQAHAENYLKAIQPLLEIAEPPAFRPVLPRRPMLYHDRAIFTDLDQNLLGDPVSLRDFLETIRQNRNCATFGIATGRSLESALRIMRRYGIPQPDVLITSVGTEIYYAPNLTSDVVWLKHIDYLWQPKRVRETLSEIEGIKLQDKTEQSQFKISYNVDSKRAPSLDEIHRLLRQAELSVNVFLSFGQYLDIVPVRASKGFALRWFADQWQIPLDHVLAAGGSGTDEDMLRGNTLAVVVANRHEEELSQLTEADSIYFASKDYARGILEAIDHYDFFSTCNVPTEEKDS